MAAAIKNTPKLLFSKVFFGSRGCPLDHIFLNSFEGKLRDNL